MAWISPCILCSSERFGLYIRFDFGDPIEKSRPVVDLIVERIPCCWAWDL